MSSRINSMNIARAINRDLSSEYLTTYQVATYAKDTLEILTKDCDKSSRVRRLMNLYDNMTAAIWRQEKETQTAQESKENTKPHAI